jgi:hypothetical protein
MTQQVGTYVNNNKNEGDVIFIPCFLEWKGHQGARIVSVANAMGRDKPACQEEWKMCIKKNE